MNTWVFLIGICIQLNVKLGQAAPTSPVYARPNEEESFMEMYARRMKSLMNESVDPCDDFYEYACGNYPNVIQDTEKSYKPWNFFDIFDVLMDHVDSILKKTRDPDEEYYEELKIAKQFVDVCTDAKLYPIQPSEEYLKVIKAIGGFPAIDPSWDESAFDWFNMTAHLNGYGIDGFFQEAVHQAYPFPPRYRLPRLGFGFDVYPQNIATKESDGYIYNEKVMRNLLQIYGVTGNNADSVIDEVFEMLREVSEIQAPFVGKEFVRKECAELSHRDDLSPDFLKWNNIFEIAWGEPNFKISYISYCPCSWFYNKVDQLAEQKPKAFANYMALRFLSQMHLQLKSTKFQRRKCVSYVKDAMPTLFSHFYIKEHYDKEAEDVIFLVIQELKDSLADLIKTAEWLDETSKLEALTNLTKLQSRVGQIVDPTSEFYIKQIRTLNVTSNHALNTLQLAKFKVDMYQYVYLHRIGDTHTSSYGSLDAVKVTAFYNELSNTINLMAGMLHPPAYHKSFPNSVKYGSLGFIVGHELGHGFEDYGFKIPSILTQTGKSSTFANRNSSCFLEDYQNFKTPGFDHKFNGHLALSEILADSAALKPALSAYRKVILNGLKKGGPDFLRREYLPGFKLNRGQTFFLSFAQLFCAKYEPRDYWNEIHASHPVDKYRVIGTLRNFDEFSEVYECPAGSPMNPTDKCRFW